MEKRDYRLLKEDFLKVELYENDYNYPWDESYTMDMYGTEVIRRHVDTGDFRREACGEKKY